jgi:hypothetical protein
MLLYYIHRTVETQHHVSLQLSMSRVLVYLLSRCCIPISLPSTCSDFHASLSVWHGARVRAAAPRIADCWKTRESSKQLTARKKATDAARCSLFEFATLLEDGKSTTDSERIPWRMVASPDNDIMDGYGHCRRYPAFHYLSIPCRCNCPRLSLSVPVEARRAPFISHFLAYLPQ